MSDETNILLRQLVFEVQELNRNIAAQQPGGVAPTVAAALIGGVAYQKEQNRLFAAKHRRAKRVTKKA